MGDKKKKSKTLLPKKGKEEEVDDLPKGEEEGNSGVVEANVAVGNLFALLEPDDEGTEIVDETVEAIAVAKKQAEREREREEAIASEKAEKEMLRLSEEKNVRNTLFKPRPRSRYIGPDHNSNGRNFDVRNNGYYANHKNEASNLNEKEDLGGNEREVVNAAAFTKSMKTMTLKECEKLLEERKGSLTKPEQRTLTVDKDLESMKRAEKNADGLVVMVKETLKKKDSVKQKDKLRKSINNDEPPEYDRGPQNWGWERFHGGRNGGGGRYNGVRLRDHNDKPDSGGGNAGCDQFYERPNGGRRRLFVANGVDGKRATGNPYNAGRGGGRSSSPPAAPRVEDLVQFPVLGARARVRA